MSRAVFLRLVSLGVLLYTLWLQITCNGDTNRDNCELCHYNFKDYPVNYPLSAYDLSSQTTSIRSHQAVWQVPAVWGKIERSWDKYDSAVEGEQGFSDQWQTERLINSSFIFLSSSSAGKRELDRRCTSWHCLTSSLTSPCSFWWSFHAGTSDVCQLTLRGRWSAVWSHFVLCMTGWWWTTGPISWLSGWGGRSS